MRRIGAGCFLHVSWWASLFVVNISPFVFSLHITYVHRAPPLKISQFVAKYTTYTACGSFSRQCF
jgi:hypothetical protein